MKLFKKLAAAGLSVIIAGSLLAGCGSTADTAQIDGTKTVVTINEDEVPLGTLSFLAKYQQAQMYAMYTAYFGQPKSLTCSWTSRPERLTVRL